VKVRNMDARAAAQVNWGQREVKTVRTTSSDETRNKKSGKTGRGRQHAVAASDAWWTTSRHRRVFFAVTGSTTYRCKHSSTSMTLQAELILYIHKH